MAEFSKLITTSDGKALIAKMLAGKADIDFTRVASSDTQYDITDLEALTELTNIQQSSLISHKEISNQLSVKLETSFTNTKLTTGYYMRALGLYAVDPELTAGEILFAVTIETSGNCYIPPYNGVTVSGAVINLITTVGNAENVHMDVDPAAVATLTDLTRKVDIGGGDISKTKIVVADAVTTEFPVPDAGDTGQGFLGKVKKFCADFNNFRAGIITLGKLVNNGQCDQSGFALDARYGKTLTDLYTQLNSNLTEKANKADLIGKINNYDIANEEITSGTILDFVLRNLNNRRDAFIKSTYRPPDIPSGLNEGYIQALRATGGGRTIIILYSYEENDSTIWRRRIFAGKWLDNWIRL